MTIAFLPLVSASSGRSGRKDRNSCAVSHAPVRMTRSTRGSAMRVAPRLPSSTCTKVSTSSGTPAAQSASASTAPHRLAGRGLQHDRAPGRQGGEHAARGDGDREVPGGCDDGQVRRREPGAVHGLELERMGGVPAGEVDRLADLGVRLVDGLAGLAHHHLDELTPAAFELVTGALQHGGALGGGPVAPGRARARPTQQGVQRIRLGERCAPRASRRRAASPSRARGSPSPRRGARRRRDPCRPRCRRAPRRRAAERRARTRDAAGAPVVEEGERGEEALPLPLEEVLAGGEVEHRRHEVLVAGPFLEPADEVRDRDVELPWVHDRRVDEQAAHVPRTASAWPVAIPSSISKSMPSRTPRSPASSQAWATSKRLWPATPSFTASTRSGVEGVVEDPLVVGVGLGLRVPGGERPVVQRRLHPLHRAGSRPSRAAP